MFDQQKRCKEAGIKAVLMQQHEDKEGIS